MQVVFGNLEVCSYGNGLIMESAEWITPSQSQRHHRLKVGIHSSTEISLLHQWLVNQTSPSPTPLALIVDLLPPSPFFPKQASMFGVTAYPFHQLACCLHHRHHHPSGNLPHLPPHERAAWLTYPSSAAYFHLLEDSSQHSGFSLANPCSHFAWRRHCFAHTHERATLLL